MPPDRLRALSVSIAEVTPKTRWIFLEIETEEGFRGAGEATLPGQDDAVVGAVADLVPLAFAATEAAPRGLARPELRSLPQAAALSALDQALWDVAARRRGVSLAEALGGRRRDAVALYANINRRTLDRSPAGFAASAADALAAGHEAIKVAPFDEATPEARRRGDLGAAIGPGLARVEAVRHAIGPHRRLMVDCHWRLDEAAAGQVIAAAADLGVHWVECPLPETTDTVAALRRLRLAANQRGVLLAGCEQGIGADGFLPFLQCYDVMMPDAKYVGGLDEMLGLAELMRREGVAFSPHNPSGPVCHAVSLQVCAAVADLHSLEMQFDETPLFDALAGWPPQRATAGCTSVSAGPGLGIAIDTGRLAACRSARWVAMRRDGGALRRDP